MDYDEELITIIVNHFREKKIEDPTHPVTSPPYVPPQKQESFQRLLEYFGLVDFFTPPRSPDNINPEFFQKHNFVQCNDGSSITVTEDEPNKIKFVSTVDRSDYYRVACKTALDPSGDGCYWKVKVDKLQINNVFLGIVGNLNRNQHIYRHPECYGWTKRSMFYKGVESNQEGINGWTEFVDGESLYFSFKSNQLKMHRVQLQKTFVINDIDTSPTKKFYFHIGFYYKGTTVTLEPLNAKERAAFDETK